MTLPNNHHLILSTPASQMRGEVLSVKHLGRGVATLLVETRDTLQMDVTYAATYHTPSQEAASEFQVFRISLGPRYQWRWRHLHAGKGTALYCERQSTLKLPVEFSQAIPSLSWSCL